MKQVRERIINTEIRAGQWLRGESVYRIHPNALFHMKQMNRGYMITWVCIECNIVLLTNLQLFTSLFKEAYSHLFSSRIEFIIFNHRKMIPLKISFTLLKERKKILKMVLNVCLMFWKQRQESELQNNFLFTSADSNSYLHGSIAASLVSFSYKFWSC